MTLDNYNNFLDGAGDAIDQVGEIIDKFKKPEPKPDYTPFIIGGGFLLCLAWLLTGGGRRRRY